MKTIYLKLNIMFLFFLPIISLSNYFPQKAELCSNKGNMTYPFKLLALFSFFFIAVIPICGCHTTSAGLLVLEEQGEWGRKQSSVYYDAAAKEYKESQANFEKARDYADKQMCDKAAEAYLDAEESRVLADTYKCYSSLLNPYAILPSGGPYKANCDSRKYHLLNRAKARVQYREKICKLKQSPLIGPFFFNDSSNANYQEGVDLLNKNEVIEGVMSLSLAAYTGSSEAAYTLGRHYLYSGDAEEAIYWFAISSMMSDGLLGQWELIWGELAYDLSRHSRIKEGSSSPSYLYYIFATEKTRSKTNDPERKFLINMVGFCSYDFDYDSGQFKTVPETIKHYSNYLIEYFQELAREGYQQAEDVVAKLVPWAEETQDVKKQASLCRRYQEYWYQKATEQLTPWLQAYENQ